MKKQHYEILLEEEDKVRIYFHGDAILEADNSALIVDLRNFLEISMSDILSKIKSEGQSFEYSDGAEYDDFYFEFNAKKGKFVFSMTHGSIRVDWEIPSMEEVLYLIADLTKGIPKFKQIFNEA